MTGKFNNCYLATVSGCCVDGKSNSERGLLWKQVDRDKRKPQSQASNRLFFILRGLGMIDVDTKIVGVLYENLSVLTFSTPLMTPNHAPSPGVEEV